jgi:hypothetical protein
MDKENTISYYFFHVIDYRKHMFSVNTLNRSFYSVFHKTNRNLIFVNSKRFYNSNTDSHQSYERDKNEKNNIVPIHIISDEEYHDLMKKKDGEMEFIIDTKQIEMLKDLEEKSLNQI